MKSSNRYRVIGVMSGSSLDGLDIVHCTYTMVQGIWQYTLLQGTTKRYNSVWKEKLAKAHTLSGLEFVKLDYEYGKFIGNSCSHFMRSMKISQPDLIASHGHTVFHQPALGITCQIGNGHAIHAKTGVTVVNDFRALDIMLGGEGAPLAPWGDKLLFSQYESCLNLGGIANISIRKGNRQVAQDICFANMGLNYLAEKCGKSYDKNGKIAASGVIDENLLTTLNNLYYKWERQKPSLGREQFQQYIEPILNQENIALPNVMRTFCESICVAIDRCVGKQRKRIKILTTGGGALNEFVIQRLKARIDTRADVIVPSVPLVMFKEAILFGLLGILCVKGEVNVVRSATKSRRNSSSGCVIGHHYSF